MQMQMPGQTQQMQQMQAHGQMQAPQMPGQMPAQMQAQGQAAPGPYADTPQGYLREGVGARSSARSGRKV